MKLEGSFIFASLAFLFAIGSIIYLKRMQNVIENDIKHRIRTEYPPESRKQILEFYRSLKIKEMEGLFSKILDDAKGDVNKVGKLTNVAESIGWKAFLENEW